jgi:predicted nucleic acid-binding protein
VDRILLDSDNACYLHVANLIEIYYHFLRVFDEPTAQQSVQDIIIAGVIIHRELSDELWQDAATLKAEHSVSLADCFFLALARLFGGIVVTSDHHELDTLVPLGLCPILFFR